MRNRNAILPLAGRAFTLVEVLCVVALLATLLALLLPALWHAQQQARAVSCMTNLRRIGQAVGGYAIDNDLHLPLHHRQGDISFDTFAMRLTEEQPVNLGLLMADVSSPATFYCPTQTADCSADIAYDSRANRWRWRWGPGGPGGGPAPGSGPAAPPTPPAGPNASYAARAWFSDPAAAPAWLLSNYQNKVIYSDFIGVDNWPGRGRLGNGLCAPHASRGYNRLFGDGSVQWAPAEALDVLRPVGPAEPTVLDLWNYYELLDLVP